MEQCYILGTRPLCDTWELAAVINELLTDLETAAKRYNMACAVDHEETCCKMTDRMDYIAMAMNRVDARVKIKVHIDDNAQITELEPLYDGNPMTGLSIKIEVIE